MRSDISDTLPGVAIAISLVPPLAVVGLLLQVGRYGDAAHAVLLFATNVAAIVATGTVVLLLYRVRDVAAGVRARRRARARDDASASSPPCVVVVMVPLAVASRSLAADVALANRARPVAEAWAAAAGWQITFVDAASSVVTVTALGPPPDHRPRPAAQGAQRRRACPTRASRSASSWAARATAPPGGTTCSAAAPGS